jgi:putative membrane protein
MTIEVLLRYIHFICILVITGTLAAEHVLLKKEMTRSEVRRIAKIDALYGLAALTLVIAGLTLWLGSFGKPSIYYTRNWIFHIKLTAFICIGLVSIYPTIFFIKQRKGIPDERVKVPSSIFLMLRLELLLLLIIPLLAGMMARGVGLR